MKAKPQQIAQMQAAYERYKESHLSKADFCQKEGLSVAQFAYWIKRFEKESQPSAFTQVNFPAIQPPISHSPTTLSAPTATHSAPLMVLDVAGKARLEFYSPVEASFLRTLLLE